MIAGMKFAIGVMVAIGIFYGLMALVVNSLWNGTGRLASIIGLGFILTIILGVAGLIGSVLGF